MAAAEVPDRGPVGFYVQRLWPWATAVARAAIATGLVCVLVAAWLVRDELQRSDPAKALALVAVATAVASIASGKIAKEFAERVTRVLAATVSVGAVLYAAGVFDKSISAHNQWIAVVGMAVALQLVMCGAAALNFQSAVDDSAGALRTWSEAEQHADRPALKTRPIGLWELLTVPLLVTTFRGIFSLDLPYPGAWVLGFGGLYALLFVTSGIYLVVPRLMLTPVVTTAEAEEYLRRHGAVRARALPLRAAWKRVGTWRRASLPRTGPYRLSTFRRVCRRLGVPEPHSEFELSPAEPDNGGC